MTGFIFGKGTPDTYESLQAKRLTATRLATAAMRAPKDVGEGLTSLAQAIAYRRLNGQIAAGEKAGRDEYKSALGALLGGSLGGPASYAPAQVSAPVGPTNITMTPTTDNPAGLDPSIIAAVDRVAPNAPVNMDASQIPPRLMADLGKDFQLTPEQAAGVVGNLAAETGGFRQMQEVNPVVPGSRGGAGFAMWTGPRRNAFEQYAQANGLNPNSYEANYGFLAHELKNTPEGAVLDSVRSAQTPADAAVAFQNGYERPGVPNTGSRVGYANQFADGGTVAPGGLSPNITMSTQSAPGGDIAQIAELMSNPYASEGDKAILGMLLQQRMAGMDPMAALDLQIKQAELNKLQHPQADNPASVDEYNFAVSQGYNGSFVDYQTEKAKAGATNISVGGEDAKMGQVPAGMVAVKDPTSPAGYRLVPLPGGPADNSTKLQAQTDAADTVTGTITNAAARARDAASKRNMGASGTTLMGQLPWTDSAEVMRQVGTLKSIATIETLNQMRQASPTGGALGNVTEGEGKMLAAKAGALDPNSPNFVRDLNDYELTLLKTIHGPEAGQKIYDATHNGQSQVSDADLFSKYGISP